MISTKVTPLYFRRRIKPWLRSLEFTFRASAQVWFWRWCGLP